MDFLKALTLGQQLLDMMKMLAQITQANTEAVQAQHATQLQLLAAQEAEKNNG